MDTLNKQRVHGVGHRHFAGVTVFRTAWLQPDGVCEQIDLFDAKILQLSNAPSDPSLPLAA